MSEQPLGEREALVKAQEIMDRRMGVKAPLCVEQAISGASGGMDWGRCHALVSEAVLAQVARMMNASGLVVEHADMDEVLATSEHAKIEVRCEGVSYRARVIRNAKIIADEAVSGPEDISRLMALL